MKRAMSLCAWDPAKMSEKGFLGQRNSMNKTKTSKPRNVHAARYTHTHTQLVTLYQMFIQGLLQINSVTRAHHAMYTD